MNGQVFIVTGASSGLGEQLARALASAGAIPVPAARRAQRLAQLERELPGVHAVACDVTDAGDRERLARRGGAVPARPRQQLRDRPCPERRRRVGRAMTPKPPPPIKLLNRPLAIWRLSR